MNRLSYEEPTIEVVEVELEGVIAASDEYFTGNVGNPTDKGYINW